ncbi:glycosyl transferase [Flavobacterium magnum]|uniref:Glycosyl transferase n=1 Tax=Flavobacterium magnum TaxID=2162713 RepID=A0A2S0REW7_9FLAO|nr:glycosyltransferase [Flavobacterium magnum]AWA29778.1 glycosyl transferase [Flavobacterium magnum]
MVPATQFSILISTRNRREALDFTLRRLLDCQDGNVEVLVFDDGSTDGTFDHVRFHFPWVTLQRNETSRGYMYCRNKMLNETKARFAISLDDDAHFLTTKPFDAIAAYFAKHPQCGLIAMRIFWGTNAPASLDSREDSGRVRGFVGCAHAWCMESWRKIPDYPEWFGFYGEEDFASYQMFKKNIEVHYLPEVLVQHRVNVADRRKDKDYGIRLRRSLRAGWYLFLLFYPLSQIPRIMAYSVWMQLKLKVFKGDVKALKALCLAGIDLLISLPKIARESRRFTKQEFQQYQQLPATKIYWQPEK